MKERINYIKSGEGDKLQYTGKSVNTGSCCSAKTVEDLRKKIAAMITMWGDMMKEIAENEDNLEMVEMTEE